MPSADGFWVKTVTVFKGGHIAVDKLDPVFLCIA